MKTVTIYGKPGCHLCDEVQHVVEQVARRRRFRLRKKNILDDENDAKTYATAIPVVMVDGLEIARYRLTAYQLEAALADE